MKIAREILALEDASAEFGPVSSMHVDDESAHIDARCLL